MKLLPLLAIGLAVAAASHIGGPEWLRQRTPEDRQITVDEFKSGKEYLFTYEGQLATGVPSSSQQHSALRLQAVCSLIFESDHKCVLRIKDARWAKLNDRLPSPRNIMPFESFQNLDVDEEQKSKITLPVMFEYKNGMVDNVVFDGEELPWSANVKRAIINMIQVNLHKQRRVDTSVDQLNSIDQLQHNSESFTVMEPSLEGECETSYTVLKTQSQSSSGKDEFKVTKSINFEKCSRRPEVKYNYRFEDMCPTCKSRYSDEERVLKSSTVSKCRLQCNGDKRKCLLEQCRVESQYNFVPFGEENNVVTTYVNQLLTLVKSGDVESEIRKPSNPIQSDSDMVYTLDWDVDKEQFFMDGEESYLRQPQFGGKTPFDIENKVEFVKNILVKLVHYMRESVEEEAPRQFARLVKVLRMLKREEIEQCHQRFFQGTPEEFTREDHKIIKNLLPDAVAQCGTRSCVKHLIHIIKNNQVSGFKASMLIRKLIDIRVVSEEMINEIFELSKEGVSQDNEPLRQACYLTTGSLLNALCEPNRDKLAIESKRSGDQICPRSLKQQWVEKLMEKFHSSDKLYNKVLVLKTLSNAGLEPSVTELEKIIRNVDKVHQTVLRNEAILALRQLRETMSPKIIRMLMPIVMNKKEQSSVRITAFYEIMHCNPEKQILDKLSLMLNTENNKQVASFVYTYMQNLANSTNPCESRIATDLKLSLRLAKYLPVRSWISYSKTMRSQWYDQDTNMGSTLEMNTVNSHDSVLPKVAALNLQSLFGGKWNKYLLTFGFKQNGIDQVLRRLLRSKSHYLQSKLSDIISGRSNSPKFNYRSELKDLFNELNINERELEQNDEQPYGHLWMKYMDQEFAFMPLHKDFLPESLQSFSSEEGTSSGTSSISQLLKQLERYIKELSVPFNFQTGTFLNEWSRKIPTSMGLPIRVTMKTPAVFKSSGVLKIKSEDNFGKIKIQLQHFKPSMVATNVMKVEMWSPAVNSGVKVISQAKIYLPCTAHLTVDTTKANTEVRFVWEPVKDVTRPIDIIRIHSRPMTTSVTWPKSFKYWQEPEEFTIQGSEWNRVNTFNKETGEKWLGIKFTMRGQWHHTPEKSVAGTPTCPLSGPNTFVITMSPGLEMPKELRITASGKLFDLIQNGKLSPSSFKKFYEKSDEYLQDSSEESGESGESGETSRTSRTSSSGSQGISQEYISKFDSGRPTRHQLKFEVDSTGSSIKRFAKLTTDCQCSEQMHSCKCRMEIDRTPIPGHESDDWKFEGEVETLYPKTPFTMKELSQMSNKRVHINVQSKWGTKHSQDKYMNIKIVGDRSQQQKQRLERSVYRRLSELHSQSHKSLFSPVAQYETLVKYGSYDEYKILVDYQVSDSLKNMTNKWYRSLKHKYYSQSQVNQINVNNQDNQLKIKFNIDPVNQRYLNVSINTPNERCQMKDIPLPTRMPLFNIRRRSSPSTSWGQLMDNTFTHKLRPTCQVRSDRVETFDQVEYNVPFTTCYSVVAKDCSSSRNGQFAVLVKKQQSNDEKKNLKIVTPNLKLVIRSTDEESQYECEVNGEQKPCRDIFETLHEEHEALRCQRRGPSIKCELRETGLRVYFDQYSVDVTVSPLYRNTVCGLCGDYDLEQQNEFDNERTYSPESIRDVFKKYLTRSSEECNVEEELVENIRSYERRPLSWRQRGNVNRYFSDESQHVSSMERPCELTETCDNEWSSEIWDQQPELSQRTLEQLSIDSPTRSTKRVHSIKPIMRTRVLERGHDVCFSMQPIPRCPRDTYVRSYESETIKVPYTCLSRSDPQVDIYTRLASRDNIIDEVSRMPATYAETEIVPKSCRYY